MQAIWNCVGLPRVPVPCSVRASPGEVIAAKPAPAILSQARRSKAPVPLVRPVPRCLLPRIKGTEFDLVRPDAPPAVERPKRIQMGSGLAWNRAPSAR